MEGLWGKGQWQMSFSGKCTATLGVVCQPMFSTTRFEFTAPGKQRERQKDSQS